MCTAEWTMCSWDQQLGRVHHLKRKPQPLALDDHVYDMSTWQCCNGLGFLHKKKLGNAPNWSIANQGLGSVDLQEQL